MLELIAAAAAFLPHIAIGAGPVGLVMAFFARSGGVWLKFAAAALVAMAIAGATVHYMKLRSDSEKLASELALKAGLEASLGCPGRPPAERDLFACIPARDRDIEHARAETIRRNEEVAAKARRALEVKLGNAQTDLAAANWVIEQADKADDGPLPKVMLDNWRRERGRRGVR